MTIKQIAANQGVKPASLSRKLKRKGHTYGINDHLSMDALVILGVEDSIREETPPIVDAKHLNIAPPLKSNIDQKKEIERLRVEIERLNKTLESREKTRVVAKDVEENMRMELSELGDSLKERDKDIEGYLQTIEIKEDTIVGMLNMLKEKDISIFDLQKELKSANEISGSIASNLVDAEERILVFEDEIKKLKELNKQLMTKLKGKPWFIVMINMLPNIMIGLSASYGVYHFSSQFMPQPFPLIEAAAFEFIYIRLTMMKGLSDKMRTLARRVSIGAVLVSVVYNTISARMYMDSGWMDDSGQMVFWIMAILHGLPLAVIGYFVVEVHFHESE